MSSTTHQRNDISDELPMLFTSFSDYFPSYVTSADTALAGASGSSGNCKATPNSSVTSSSTEAAGDQEEEEKKMVVVVAKDHHEEDGGDKLSKQLKQKGNKKGGGNNRQREQRFTFMTKSEVDHLEDGYRWRKYGQKAVKNSPYPRSYYRCTTQKCGVKKRVERSFQDPSVVMTTYEGQHTHHSPASVRGTSHILPPPPPPPLAAQQPMNFQYQEQFMHQFPQYIVNNNNIQQQQQYFDDYGLLQDVIVPSFSFNQP